MSESSDPADGPFFLAVSRTVCFNLVVRAVWILVLLVGLVLPGQSQSTPDTLLEKFPYLLRISRVVPHLDTCVLLRHDGGYHLERDHDDATEVYEGELRDEELAKLEHWLESEQLRKLSREQIVMPLVITRAENVQISIFRGDHWQDLIFPSSESQVPFHESLAPLLEWFNALHNQPHRTIPEDAGKNNCLTPRRIELRTRPAVAPQTEQQGMSAVSGGTEPSADANVPTISRQMGQPGPSAAGAVLPAQADVESALSATATSFLMRFDYTRFAGREAERTCAIVYVGGRYHTEKSSQEVGGQVKAQIHEAFLEAADLQGLRQLLDDPSLKALEHGNIPDGGMFSFTDVTTVWIPRDKKVQHLGFASDLRVQAAIGSHYVVNDKNAKVVRPLEKWVRTELPADKTTLVKGAVANQCAPK